ncbi:MAG: Rieske (2Fe-2S) protein [Candidatus Sumerlaeia bacterium]|nr:Rieske (2Fe-2S) protein [Candidatus Sumerlaeia bacterium]
MTELAKVADIPEGRGIRVEAGGQEIALINCGGTIYAIEPNCPHMGGPLDEGELDGSTLICPWHGWEIDLTSGKCSTTGEDHRCFEIEVKDGTVFLKA